MANHSTQLKDSVTVPKEEYLNLKQQARAYQAFAAKVFEISMDDPVSEVVDDFRATGLYSEAFLDDLGDGLKKSSYTKKYADQSVAE